MDKNIETIKDTYLNSTFDYDNSLTYIGERLKEIRLELKSEKKIDKNVLNEILEFNATIINRLEDNKGVAYQDFIKVLNLYKAFGYNPQWIISKDNIFINKFDVESEVILNSASVSEALNDLIQSFKTNQTNMSNALDEFKNKLT
ncbi:MAG: hypothetical protein RR447_02260 [Algoriella sp.]|uniref:hypothetical protein n=1 Tax=Algoriella sp. TaxID=1872434 RepID=UPI002FC5F4CA